MTGDDLIRTQLLMAQAVNALADAINNATGTVLSPVAFAALPVGPAGALVAINDSAVNTWGAVITGGGTFKVLGFYNGTAWTVAGV